MEGVTASELQAAAGILVPSGSAGLLEGYSEFIWNQRVCEWRISALYKPTFQRILGSPMSSSFTTFGFAYDSQSAATAGAGTFDRFRYEYHLPRGHDLFYQSEGGNNVDSFGTVDAEYLSFHALHRNGNLLFQASLFREDGIFDENLNLCLQSQRKQARWKVF